MMDFFKPKSIEVWSLPVKTEESLKESILRFNNNRDDLIKAVAGTNEYH